MTPHNSYPEKPEVAFQKTHVEMRAIISAIKQVDYPAEVKRAVYVIIRNETLNGRSVINDTNLCGAQGDADRWPSKFDRSIIATCTKRENKRQDGSGGDMRRFLIFNSLQSCVAFACDRAQEKGIFIGSNGGKYHTQPVVTKEDLADAYEDEWVYGEDHKTSKIEARDIISMYNQAEKIFQ